ncbi:MAG: N-formylglutamate deformylase [Proteobacteria bacterium]|nr:N-formylglutamate deformylase [Pseudomonadota bacterium]
MQLHRFRAGRTPLLVSLPHSGTHIPEPLLARMTPAARRLPDTDWHLEKLYDFLDELGASVLAATHSRYVIDLNRSPDGGSLYPGMDTTALVPVDTFFKVPVYLAAPPAEEEIRQRVETYWQPYHQKLAGALEAIRAEHGTALLWDAHSIFSVVPRFFDGRLTDFNLGTAGGKSCAPGMGERLVETVKGFSAVLNGRFKGGYITRRYGDPANNVHAVQLELSEATYMEEEPPYAFREDLAARVRPRLRALLEEFLRAAPRRAPPPR